MKRQIEGVLNLIDDNLEEINEFKEISHNIELAFDIVIQRIEKIEKRLDTLESKILKDGFTFLERKIMVAIRDETRKFQESLIDYTTPDQEIKKIGIIPRDNDSNIEDKTSD